MEHLLHRLYGVDAPGTRDSQISAVVLCQPVGITAGEHCLYF